MAETTRSALPPEDMDLERSPPDHNNEETPMLKKYGPRWETVVLAYKTLGVVFGALVTNSLFVFPSMSLDSPTEDDYLGIYSIMFWSLTFFGVIKYICIALYADDNGEGGTFALYSLLCRHADVGIISRSVTDDVDHQGSPSDHHVSPNTRYSATQTPSKLAKFIESSVFARRFLLFIAILGLCMLIGDGILTPAITVLSAIDGLKGPVPSIGKNTIKAISAVVLVLLFLLQKHGTSRVSFLFSPIILAWTITTPIIGVYNIARHYPSVFKSISPHYVYKFFLNNTKEGWLLLGVIVLTVTGSEAMFADLGHFDRGSIQMAFMFTIYPSLILTYAGQTAYLIKNPGDYGDAFYKFVPSSVYWPMFVVATSAAIVASQSMISAIFCVIKQTVLLDYFPRVTVVHTSSSHEGEVYCPEINHILMVLCVAIVLGFGDSKDIGNAFGVVVTQVMLITTIMLTLVMIIIWNTPLFLVCLYFTVSIALEGAYTSSVFTKIPQGGWVTFAISILLAVVMFGWYFGRVKKVEYEMSHKTTTNDLDFLSSKPDFKRLPGLCFFFINTKSGALTPIVSHYIKNLQLLHQVTMFVTLKYLPVPKVESHERVYGVRVGGLSGAYRCVIHYGFAELVEIKSASFIEEVVDELKACIRGGSSTSMDVQEEISELEKARQVGVIDVRGRTRFCVGKKTSWFDKTVLGFYEFLHRNCRSGLPDLAVPLLHRIEVGMLYDV